MKLGRIAAAALFAAVLPPGAAAAAEEPSAAVAPPVAADQSPAENVALRDDRHARLTVAVTVGGAGPFRFLVDTGAERTIVSHELATQLQLRPGPAKRIIGLGEAKLVPTAAVPAIGLGSLRTTPFNAAVLAGADIGADGLLGIDSLRKKRVLLDLKKRTMTLAPPLGRAAATDQDGTVVVRARERRGRLLLTDAAAERSRVRAVIDTGSEMTIGNRALRQRLFGDRRVTRTAAIRTATGEELTLEVATLRELRIGGLRLSNAVVLFSDAPVFRTLGLADQPALMIGMDVMRAFDRVAIDFATKTLHFVPPDGTLWTLARYDSGR